MVLVIKKGENKEKIKRTMAQLVVSKGKGIDAYRYCGILSLKTDPKKWQQKRRNEWK